jgi:xanthosine utilization system XapX-like protein
MIADYTLIAGLLLYFLMVRLSVSSSVKPITATLVSILGYFIFSTIVDAIMYASYKDIALSEALFGLIPIVTVILQFVAALLVFTKLDRAEDFITSWFVWGIAGCVFIFFIIPSVTTSLLASF